jgi:hypothetical protein
VKLHRIVVVAAACSALLFGCGGDSDNSSEPTPEPTAPLQGSGPAEQALGQYVQNTLNKEYLEDCARADAQRDAGKICSVFRGERGNFRAYAIGATFSEGSQWVIMEQRGNQWVVASTQQITPDNAGVPGIPWPLRPGADVVVAGAAPCLNVREGPGLNQKAVDCLADGARIRVAAGPTPGDNIQWWQVEGRAGWVAADYLRFPDALQ